MAVAWRWLIHVGGIDYGLPYGHWSWYNFWSGIGGSFLFGTLVWLAGWYLHHTCHVRTCLRPGRHPVEGTGIITCRKHHPVLKEHRRLTAEKILHLHREHLEHKERR